MYFFGGGWTLGSIDTSDGVCRALANAAGCAGGDAVGYRLAPEHPFPAAVHDCYAATAWVAANAAALGADPAGSRSAATARAATWPRWSRCWPASGAARRSPRSCWSTRTPATTRDTESSRDNDDRWMFNRHSVDWYWRNYLSTPDDGRDPLVSPLRADDLAGLPPALVHHRRVRPAARRGRGLRRPAARRGRAGRADPLRRDGARVLHDVGQARRRPAGRRAGGRVPAEEPPCADAEPVCLADFERLAEAALPPDVWDYVSGGSGTETTLAANRTALDDDRPAAPGARRVREPRAPAAGCWPRRRACRWRWRRWPTSGSCTRTASSPPPRPRARPGSRTW